MRRVGIRVAMLATLLGGALLLEPVPPLAPLAFAQAAPSESEGFGASYADVAERLHHKDCSGALAAFAAHAAEPGFSAPTTALLSGFSAYACGDAARAETTLSQGATTTVLEDWRLYVLAQSAIRLGHAPAAQAALARLLGDHADSPLRGHALLEAVTLASNVGDRTRATELIELGRREGAEAVDQAQLDGLAWQVANRAQDRTAQIAAAKRLLVEAPVEAGRLQVAAMVPPPNGLSWLSSLSADELMARANRLLVAEVADGALLSLETVPATQRASRWWALKAAALTADHRGVEALRVLDAAPPASEPAQRAALDWERARAAHEAATARRGRSNLPAAKREVLAAQAREALWRTADESSDRDLAQQALRQIFTELGDDGPYEDAVKALVRLRQLDPTDDTGARFLWDRGWKEYRARNYTGAVSHWSRLVELYPESRAARSGRYWSARAYEALNDAGRAKEFFVQVASADTNDFYRRHAVARLGGGQQPNEPPVERETWPRDPLLARAEWLAGAGLDDLAAIELDALANRADERAATALRAVILASQGNRRESMRTVRRAFPALAGPLQARLPDEALRLYYPLDFAAPVQAAAKAEGLDPALVFGIIHQESGFDAAAVSRSGARGLMQLMTSTGRELARGLGLPWAKSRLTEPEYSVRLGTSYFHQVLSMFDGNVELALAGYNGGPWRIQRLWRNTSHADVDAFVEDLTPEETKVYVKRILVLSDSYRRLYPAASGS